jgi:ATP synthase proteolipid subunit
VGVIKPDFIMKALVPVIFAAAIGIYGLIIAILINDNGKKFTLVFARNSV